jgi:methionyl aminopeptidase
LIILKTSQDIAKMRDAGRIAAEALQVAADTAKPGISTLEIDHAVRRYLKSQKAVPTFLGYNGFPAALCVSINNEVIHGIPAAQKILKDGDVVSLDVGATYNGFVGDTATTVAIGQISPQAQALLDTTKESLYAAIAQAIPHSFLGDVSHTVQRICESAGYGVVRDFTGHGVGRAMHEDPSVPNVGVPGRGVRLRAGMTIAIEPMVNMGSAAIRTLRDNWTVVTRDGSLSAHFEHSIAITSDGPVILTTL